MLKYSRNTLPKEILLGQVEESHTREQMIQISAEMLGWARRSKNWSEEQQELGLEQMGRCFSGERKSRGRRDERGAWWGPLTPGWRGQGWAAPPVCEVAWLPHLVPPRCLSAPFLTSKFIKNFLEFFEKLYFWGFFRNWHIDKTQKNEDEKILIKSKLSKQQLWDTLNHATKLKE
jgi:hypothetical protein